MTVREGTLLDRIDALIAERHLLKHPFYTKWHDGELTRGRRSRSTRASTTPSSRPSRASSRRCIRAPTDPAVRQSDARQPVGRGARRGEPRRDVAALRRGDRCSTRADVAPRRPTTGPRRCSTPTGPRSPDGPIAAGVAALYAYEGQVPEVATEKIAASSSSTTSTTRATPPSSRCTPRWTSSTPAPSAMIAELARPRPTKRRSWPRPALPWTAGVAALPLLVA